MADNDQKQKHRYIVAVRSKNGIGIVFVSPPERKLEDAQHWRKSMVVPYPRSAIYKVESGQIPEFVEGDDLSKVQPCMK
jgi:hypothetical protein